MQNYVLVLDTNWQPLEPCHPARARQLLREGKAAVFRHQPFTIILKYAVNDPQTQESELKIDPGSKTTGMALVRHGKRGPRVIWAAELEHRGETVKEALATRHVQRRARRTRNMRYRPPRFDNRRRPDGWLPPSLLSRVNNTITWAARLYRWTPYTHIAVEQVKFDTQLMDNPAISGIEYQQGTLQGYNVREYLLERDGRKCAYCGAEQVPLEIEHIVPRSRGGSDRVTNLTLSCGPCNQTKNNQTAAEFGFPNIQGRAKQRSMRDVAAVNATRNRIVQELQHSGLPVLTGTGAETKFNRTRQGYPKAHWIDAACVGSTGGAVLLDPELQVLSIKATGRQRRQMQLVDRFGFPRTKPKVCSIVRGFKTGDLGRAVVPPGRRTSGTHGGRVAVRTQGTFRVGSVDGISWRFCTLLQRADGYSYRKESAIPHPAKAGCLLAQQPMEKTGARQTC
jgi:hypothetical protein